MTTGRSAQAQLAGDHTGARDSRRAHQTSTLRAELSHVLDRLSCQKKCRPVPRVSARGGWASDPALPRAATEEMKAGHPGFGLGCPACSSPCRRLAHAAAIKLERALLERGVLERALHLVGAGRVSPAVVEVLGDRVERRPLATGLLPVVSPAPPRPRKIASTRSIARSRFARARVPVSSSITHRWRSTRCSSAACGDRLERQPVGERLELLLVVDRHPEHLARLGELGLQVAGVAKAERPLRAGRRARPGAAPRRACWRTRSGSG